MGVVEPRGLRWGEHTSGESYERFARNVLTKLASRAHVAMPEARDVRGQPVRAFVSEGRWIVGCPDCERNYSMIWRDDPVYMCPVCWNAANGGAWRRVLLPPDLDQIEAALLARPNPRTRNWLPTETVADLVRENRTHVKGG